MIEPQGEISSEDADLLARGAAWKQLPTLGDCLPAKLAEVANDHGLEFATAVLYDRILRDVHHGAFFQRARTTPASLPVPPPLVGVVPGAFHREHRGTGADGGRVAAILRSMDCRVECVPVDSFGSLARNASLIAGWLSRHPEQRVVLVSLSKGTADLKVTLTLSHAHELFSNVLAWISISGLPQGTPLVSWLRRRPWRQFGVRLLLRLRGQRYSVVEELRSEADGPLAFWPSLPRHLRVVHVVAVPLRRHLRHPWAARGYERVAPLGPNDGGGFLLGDVTQLPGTVFPIWGADHYLQPAWDTTPLLRGVFAEAMASQPGLGHAAQSAAHPIKPPASKSRA